MVEKVCGEGLKAGPIGDGLDLRPVKRPTAVLPPSAVMTSLVVVSVSMTAQVIHFL